MHTGPRKNEWRNRAMIFCGNTYTTEITKKRHLQSITVFSTSLSQKRVEKRKRDPGAVITLARLMSPTVWFFYRASCGHA